VRFNPVTLHRQVGYLLLVVVLGLISLGIIMLFSASGRFAAEGSVSMFGLLKKQAMWLCLGLILCAVLSRVDYHWLTQRAWIWIGGASFLLMLCFVPGVGKLVNGARRWLEVGGMTLQPSELAKAALICFLAYWLGKNQRRITHFWEGLAVPCLVTGGLLFLIVLEPDLGSCAVMVGILSIMLFCAGVKKRYLFPLPAIGLGSLIFIATMMPERQARLLAFLDPEKNQLGKGWQQFQALIAFGSGGSWGLGLGNSRQKMNFLPESTTDFIFPIVGEELGLWVALGVVFAFLLLLLCSGWITLHAPDPTGVLLGTGITALISIQAVVNLAVVTSLLPNKGLPLPFISYGGSNLLLCLFCIGVLFNIQRQGIYEHQVEDGLLLSRESVRI
jgi:cell division protein FtsW